MAATVWWTVEDTFGIAGWGIAVVATAGWWMKASVAALWRQRCKARDKTIRRLRAAAANRRAHARALPAAPKRPMPAPRTRLRWIWPGDNPRPLPYPYGHQPELLRIDPCLAVPPDDDTLAAWLAEDQPQSWPPLDRVGLLVERLMVQLEAAATPVTHELEAVR